MNTDTLCTLMAQKINLAKFQLRGTEIDWLVKPTTEELALAADVTANYDTLAAGYQAAKLKTHAIASIQSILDTQAKALGFDSVHTAGWTMSKNEARKARADALVAWADSVWDFAETEWANQEKGKPGYMTIEAFLKALPAFGGVE